jgi:GTPase SAR1 family protein
MSAGTDARPAAAEAALDALGGLLQDAAKVFTALDRNDLVQRLRVASLRIQRPTTVVCVVGEFKQGKSSLINAMLGGRVCPIDDDLATSALTVVHHADALQVVVRRREGEKAVSEQIDPQRLGEWVTEQGNAGNQRGVERVDIGLPHPLLSNGLTLVDTPGMGAIGAGHTAATLAFLPYADGLIFVTDATAELSEPELSFLKRARELCPTVICALTKVDLVPHWRRIAELDRGHLQAAGIDVPVIPVASPLRHLAARRHDETLDGESGIPELLSILSRNVITPAKRHARRRASVEVRQVADDLAPSLRTELEVLLDPQRQAEGMAALEAARARLEHLRGPGARWSQVLGDRMADLSSEASYALRRAVRSLQREMEVRLEELKSPADWDELGRELRTATSEAVARVFARLHEGARGIEEEVRGLLAEESLELGELRALGRQIDISSLWTDTRIDEGGPAAGRAAGTAVLGLRGAQGGIFMVSIFAQFLPAGVAGVLLAAPVSLGLGAVFAGQQLVDANRRKLAARRQKAKLAVNRFLDDVQFEVGQQLSDSVRELQRELRDGLSQRITELLRSYAGALERAQADAGRSQEEREARARLVEQSLAALEQLSGRSRELEGAL